MSLPDATASAALGAAHVRPVWFAYLDFDTDPVRANSSGATLTPSGSGDADLDGQSFIGISHAFVNITPVRHGVGGSGSVTATLSGITGIDDDTLALIANPANWRGRVARLWRLIRNADNVAQGGYQPFHTGYMTSLDIIGGADEQKISVTIETYLAAFSSASNRTYLEQERFDSGDLSARAAIAIANGISGNPAINNTPGGGGGGGAPSSRIVELPPTRQL